MSSLLTVLLVLVTATAQTAPQVEVPGEGAVAMVVEELRKAELVIDADALEPLLAYSFTHVDKEGRVAGSFAYVEPLRRLRERGGKVKELRFDTLMVHVYGASAVASYRVHKVWIDRGAQRRLDGWSTDVFERRDDGAWLLVHRQRP